MKTLRKSLLISMLTISSASLMAMEQQHPSKTLPQIPVKNTEGLKPQPQTDEIIVPTVPVVPTYPAPTSSYQTPQQSVVVIIPGNQHGRKKAYSITIPQENGTAQTIQLQNSNPKKPQPSESQKKKKTLLDRLADFSDSLRKLPENVQRKIQKKFFTDNPSSSNSPSSSSSSSSSTEPSKITFNPYMETDESKFDAEATSINFAIGALKDIKARKDFLKNELKDNENIDLERLWVCASSYNSEGILKAEEILIILAPILVEYYCTSPVFANNYYDGYFGKFNFGEKPFAKAKEIFAKEISKKYKLKDYENKSIEQLILSASKGKKKDRLVKAKLTNKN